MDEFAKTITSLSWWLGVVLVGILLNVISAYLKSPLDKFFSSISKRWRTRSEIARLQRERLIAELRENPTRQALLLEEENRYRLRGIVYALATVFNLILYLSVRLSVVLTSINGWAGPERWGQWLLFWLSMLVAFFCISALSKANSCEALLKEARAANGSQPTEP